LVASEQDKALKMPETRSFGASDLKEGLRVQLKFRG